MKKQALRVLVLMVCLVVSCAAASETAGSGEPVTHTDFTLAFALHADGFPPSREHLKDWQAYLGRLTLSGSADTQDFCRPGNRTYMEAAFEIDGEVFFPFSFDGYDTYRYLISPALRGDSVLFRMHNFLEFMLKPFYFMEIPTLYAAFFYPGATYYIADSYYAPVLTMLEDARAQALAEAGDAYTGELTYIISHERLLALCAELNAVVTDDESLNRVSRYCNTLLAELYIADVVVDTLSQFELILDALDPDKAGMTVKDTADSLTCTIGGVDVFHKTVAGNDTEIAFRLPVPEDCLVTAAYHADDTHDTLTVSVFCADEEAVTLLVECGGLPEEDALSGEGSVSVTLGGTAFTEPPAPLAFAFDWSRTAVEPPYTLDLTADWLHPETRRPTMSLHFTGALDSRDYSVFDDSKYEQYPQEDFFGLNAERLSDYKDRWGVPLAAQLLPAAMEMPPGVIDDIVNFLLEYDILAAFAE